MIKNKINNKVYIGQTTNSFDERYRNNIAKYTHNEHLKSSIDKYGIENFYIDKEFDVAYSQEELDKLEDMYIKIYESTNRKFGYNKKTGGSHGILTDEARQKISKTKKGKYTGAKNPTAVKVVCITTGVVFDSITEAGNFYNIKDYSHIGYCCKKERSFCGRHPKTNEFLVWRYLDDYKNMTKEEVEQAIRKTNGAHTIKKIICLNTNKIFNTAKEAGEFYNCNGSHISSCCTGKRKSCGKLPDGTKLQWMYYEDYLKNK